MEVNGQSRTLGEDPTKIYYTKKWPYGRYTYPEGGRFIREYGQSAPIPETLTELGEAEPPAPRLYFDSQYIEKSPELSPHRWTETTRVMTPEEREYLAALGGPYWRVAGEPPVKRVAARPVAVEYPRSRIIAAALAGAAVLAGIFIFRRFR